MLVSNSKANTSMLPKHNMLKIAWDRMAISTIVLRGMVFDHQFQSVMAARQNAAMEK
jgi:hypothetical protein